MNVGFLGTGTIANAIIRGVAKTDVTIKKIVVSPRSQTISNALANDFPKLVHIGANNQDVVDQSDIIFIALRAQDAQETLKELRFKTHQKLVSLIATASQKDIATWSGHQEHIFRAVPLPFVIDHQSATPIFPYDKDLDQIFSKIGGTITLENEEQLKIFMIAGSLMGTYYNVARSANQWIIDHGIEKAVSTEFISKLFLSLAHEAQSRSNIDYHQLELDHSTKGGTNELVSKTFTENGGTDALIKGLDCALAKM